MNQKNLEANSFVEIVEIQQFLVSLGLPISVVFSLYFTGPYWINNLLENTLRKSSQNYQKIDFTDLFVKGDLKLC